MRRQGYPLARIRYICLLFGQEPCGVVEIARFVGVVYADLPS